MIHDPMSHHNLQKVESSEVPYGRTLFNDGEAIEGYSFGQDDRGYEGPGFAPGSSAPSEPGSTSTNQFPATPSYNSYDGYRGVDMTGGNYANDQNRTKPEHMYGQQNQAGTSDNNHEGLLEHGFHVGGIPIPPVISGKFIACKSQGEPTFFIGYSRFEFFEYLRTIFVGTQHWPFFGKDVALTLCT